MFGSRGVGLASRLIMVASGTPAHCLCSAADTSAGACSSFLVLSFSAAPSCVLALLASGADPNRAAYVPGTSCFGASSKQTPLVAACQEPTVWVGGAYGEMTKRPIRFECIDALLTHGADPVLANGSGNTPASTLLKRTREALPGAPAVKTMQRLLESGLISTPDMVANALWHSSATMALTLLQGSSAACHDSGHMLMAISTVFEWIHAGVGSTSCHDPSPEDAVTRGWVIFALVVLGAMQSPEQHCYLAEAVALHIGSIRRKTQAMSSALEVLKAGQEKDKDLPYTDQAEREDARFAPFADLFAMEDLTSRGRAIDVFDRLEDRISTAELKHISYEYLLECWCGDADTPAWLRPGRTSLELALAADHTTPRSVSIWMLKRCVGLERPRIPRELTAAKPAFRCTSATFWCQTVGFVTAALAVLFASVASQNTAHYRTSTALPRLPTELWWAILKKVDTSAW